MSFELLVSLVALVAGAIAAVAGFGIGSILTPVLALGIGIKLAVAAVAIPHVIGSSIRLWTLRDKIDRRVVSTFGVMSAIGALSGAALHIYASSPALSIVFALILIFAGLVGAFGWSEKIRFGRIGAWVAGGVSGFLGGFIGNQGGIRAAAMLAFDVPKESFVATAVAIGLIVDSMRLPVYLFSEGRQLLAVWPLIALAALFVTVGTVLGRSILGRIPESLFRRIVSVLILALGVRMLLSAL